MMNKVKVKSHQSTIKQEKFAQVALTKKAAKALKGGEDFIVEDIIIF